jgi:hypothetical protein
MSIYPSEIRADLNDEQDQKAFEYEETISSPGNGEWVEFPNGVNGAAVELEIATGEGRVEATLDSLSEVQAGTANGIAWDFGNVTGTTQDWVVPVTALRGVNISGIVKIKVRMQ